jgi:3-dehydroquinate dehydratase I
MTPQIVGVIFSRADLHRALRMRKPPGLFELRLDALIGCLHEVNTALDHLAAPLIITARHRAEGGADDLAAADRRGLLLNFLLRARYVDVELRAARSLEVVFRVARARRVGVIASFHDFGHSPSRARLEKIAAEAQSLGPDVIKIAVRTDTPEQLATLLDFFNRYRGRSKLVAMGVGKLGRTSRLELARRGCLLNYAHLGSPAAAGQLSIPELRRALG